MIDKTPDTAVGTVVTIVAHDPIFILRNRDGAVIVTTAQIAKGWKEEMAFITAKDAWIGKFALRWKGKFLPST